VVVSFVVYFCGVWTLFPNWKHLLITVLGGAYCSSVGSFCLLGLLANLQKITISIIMSVYPSVRMQRQLPLDRFLMKIDIGVFFESLSRKIQF